MTEKLSRRSFFRLLGGGVAAAIVAPKLLFDKVIEIPVEYGWTWFVDKSKLPGGPKSDFAELITKTLRENSAKLAENIENNNALLVKLSNNDKALLRIDRISPEDQTKRMSDRLSNRIKNKYANNATREDEKATFFTGYEDLEKKYLT